VQSNILLCAAAMVCFAAFSPVSAQEEYVRWIGDYKEALAEAKRTGKPIFLEYRCEP
jgi:hypothetical protein